MAMLMLMLGALLVLSSDALAEKCSVKPAVQNFDIEKFSGTWKFVKESTTMWHASSKYKCSRLDFLLKDKSEGVLESDFSLIDKSTGKDKYDSYIRTIRKEDPNSTEGRLRIFREGKTGGTMYTVLDTDYDNYALIWMCRENAETGAVKEMPYALSRSGVLTRELEERATKNLPRDHTYINTDQKNCPAKS